MFTKGLQKTASIGSTLGGALNRASTVGGKLLSKATGAAKVPYSKAVGAASSVTKAVVPKPVRQAIGQQANDFKKSFKR